MVVYYFKFCF